MPRRAAGSAALLFVFLAPGLILLSPARAASPGSSPRRSPSPALFSFVVPGAAGNPAAGVTAASRRSRADSLRTLATLRRRVREDRRDAAARRDLADFLGSSEDIELRREAMEALEQAVRIDDSDPDLWIRVARLQERRGFKAEAKDAFEHALHMAPDRADLWDELAEHEFTLFQASDRTSLREAAMRANARALALDPDKNSALRRGVRLAAILDERPALDSLLSRWERVDPEGPWPLLVRGMLLVDAKAWNQAEDSFARGIARFPTTMRHEFYRLDRVDPNSEHARRIAAEPRRFFDDYWRWRDPTPADAVNPRLLEHYRRMVLAELLFAIDPLGLRGWDHAPGEMVVRYGLPPKWSYERNVVRAQTYAVTPGFAAPAIEVTYGKEEDPLSFLFVDYNLSGRYFNPVEAFPRDVDLMLVSDPSLYKAPFAARERDQEVELWRFVDGEGKGRIEVAVALDPEEWPREIFDAPHRLATKVTLYDAHWKEGDSAVGSWAPFTTDAFGRLIGIFEIQGVADSAIVGLETEDREAKGRAAGYTVLKPMSTWGAPLLSDIAFLSRVSFPGEGGGYRRGYGSGVPNPGHRYRPRDPIGIGFEAYGFRTDAEGALRARVSVTVGRQTPRGFFSVVLRRKGGRPEAEMVFDATEPGTRLEQILAVDVPPLEPGNYVLRVKVEDTIAGTNVERSGSFFVVEPEKKR